MTLKAIITPDRDRKVNGHAAEPKRPHLNLEHLPLGQKCLIQDEKGTMLCYPMYLDASCHHVQEQRFTYSFSSQTGTRSCCYWIESADIVGVAA